MPEPTISRQSGTKNLATGNTFDKSLQKQVSIFSKRCRFFNVPNHLKEWKMDALQKICFVFALNLQSRVA
jgi:hypothetical protein